MAEVAKKKPREWFISDRHEDILESTLKAREREQRLLKASLGSREKSAAEKAAAGRRPIIALDHLERILKNHITSRYDDIIDAFNECDTNGNGRVRYECLYRCRLRLIRIVMLVGCVVGSYRAVVEIL